MNELVFNTVKIIYIQIYLTSIEENMKIKYDVNNTLFVSI